MHACVEFADHCSASEREDHYYTTMKRIWICTVRSLQLLSVMIISPQPLWGAVPSLHFNILLILPNATAAATDSTGALLSPEESWQNGDEVLPGAEIALRDINEELAFQLTVTELSIEFCSSPLALVQFVRQLTSSAGGENATTVAVIGAFCKEVFYELIGIASHERIGLTQIALTTSPAAVDGRNSLHYQMLPSIATYAEALAQFMVHVGWTRIGVVFAQTHEGYYFEMSEQMNKILKERGFQVLFSVEINEMQQLLTQSKSNMYNLIEFIHHSGTKIVYILLPPIEASLLICLAYNYGLQWPEYGWIVPDVSLEDVLTFCSFGNCSRNAAEGIISFQKTEINDSTTVTGKSYETYLQEYNDLLTSKADSKTEVLKSSIYASALHDSIWAVALSLNQSLSEVQDYVHQIRQQDDTHTLHFKLATQKKVSQIIGRTLANISFPGVLGHISFDSEHQTQIPITIYQTIDGQQEKLGIHIPRENMTYYENYPPSRIPSDKLDRVYMFLPIPLGAILTVGLVACTLVAILNTFLFVFYRKEPEIKATSFSISMIIYLGCYLLYIGTGVHIISSSMYFNDKVVCLVEVWTTHIGADIIFSTLLVKVCRIHHVFTYFGKVGKICTDQTLLILIVVIVLGKVAILSTWITEDLFRITDFETYNSEGKPPYYEVVQFCHCRHSATWHGISLSYTFAFACILAIVSFKTRKIQRKDFKDTKKINVFILTYFMGTSILGTLWWLLQTVGNPNISKTLVTIIYLLIPLCCQVYLLSPKTLPPLKRRLGCYRQKSRIRRESNFNAASSSDKARFMQRPDPSQLSLNSSNFHSEHRDKRNGCSSRFLERYKGRQLY